MPCAYVRLCRMSTGPRPFSSSDSSPGAANVLLRPVTPADLDTLYEFQLDPESNRMAAVVPRTREVFLARWQETLNDPAAMGRAIVADAVLVGSIGCFPQDMPWGEKAYAVGYGVGREYWGRGIATRALALLLGEVTMRPMYARAARENLGSLRVLERCGFKVIQYHDSPASERYLACVEAVLRLE